MSSNTYSGSFSSPRAKNKLALGLQNQGATCYLNSLIVSLYMTPEFRKSIYSLQPGDLFVEEASVGSATQDEEKKAEAPVDPAFEALCGMGFLPEQVRKALRKFPFDPDNMQRVEYILSGDADLDPDVAPEPAKEKEEAAPARRGKERRIPKELQKLFCRMQAADSNAGQSTKPLTDCFGQGFSAGVQHDVHELNRILFDRIEKQLRGTAIQNVMNQLYRGTLVNRILCQECGHKSEREEDFLDVSLVVGDFKDMLESFASAVTDEELSGDNKYECSGCNKKVDALKGARIRVLPPVMIVSLSRFEYNKVTWQRVKNSKSFPFPRQLDMKAYMENPGDQEQLYDLFGVVIHRGDQASHGHYHAYLLDLLNESGNVGKPASEVLGEGAEGVFEGWYDFNDSSVSPISNSKVETQFGGAANKSECAYMLIYRHRTSPLLMKPGDAPPALPEHLASEIHAENDELQKKRAEWEELRNKLEVNFYIPASLEQRPGGLIRLKDKNDDDEGQVTRAKIMMDKRKTLGDLKLRALELFGDAVPPLDQMQLHRIRFLDQTQKRLKFLRPLDKPLSSDGKEIAVDDTAVLDSLATVTNGCEVLVWDGVHLCDGEPCEVVYDLITVCVVSYDENGDSKRFDVPARESSTLGELLVTLRRDFGIYGGNLWIFRVDYSRLTELTGIDRTLHELHLTDHVKISIEPKTEQRSEISQTLSAASLRETEEKINVFVTNNCDASVVRDAVGCNLGMTVWDLKMALVKKIGTLNERMPMRLRRTTAGGGEGALFQDESSSLRKAGVETNMRVILEYGEPPDSSNITVKYTWGTPSGVKLLEEMQSICVEVSLELGQLKMKICKELHLDGPSTKYRLRKTDFWASQKEIFDDEDKTLKQLGFKDSDCVWIEEGAIPPKGQIELHVELQTPTWNNPKRNEGALSRNVTDLWDLDTVSVIQINRSALLEELRAEILKDAALAAVLGGRDFRIWSKSGRVLRGPKKTLKKLGISSSSAISVQPLDGPESAEALSEDAVLLLFRERLSETKTYGAPVETVVLANRRSTHHFMRRGELIRHIYSIANLADGERLLVAKLIPQSMRWRVIVDPFEVEETEMISMGADANKENQKSNKDKKHADDVNLSDGDLIVFKVISKDPDNKDDFVTELNHSVGINYVPTSGSRGSEPSKPSQRPKEIGLMIDDDW